MVHGAEKAADAAKKAKAAFGGDAENMPTVRLAEAPASVCDAIVAAGAAKSKSEARRLIEGGGVKIDEANAVLGEAVRKAGEFVLHKGKKVHIRVLFR